MGLQHHNKLETHTGFRPQSPTFLNPRIILIHVTSAQLMPSVSMGNTSFPINILFTPPDAIRKSKQGPLGNLFFLVLHQSKQVLPLCTNLVFPVSPTTELNQNNNNLQKQLSSSTFIFLTCQSYGTILQQGRREDMLTLKPSGEGVMERQVQAPAPYKYIMKERPNLSAKL